MRVLQHLLAVSIVALSAQTALADDAGKAIWRVEGVKNPESSLFDGATNKIYVSSVNGAPTEKDGNGFVSVLSPDGKMVTSDWATGLNAPKGMGIHGGVLYVADIDELVAVDLKSGAIKKKYAANGAKFLNDIAVDGEGRIYVSDMAANAIWRLDGERFEIWLESPDLKSPNGLTVTGNDLIVGSWGKMTEGFATKIPGHLLRVSLADKSIASVGNGKPVGNLDGLEILSDTEFLVSDWMAGKVLKVKDTGEAVALLDLNQGSADLGYDPKTQTIFVPMMKDNAVLAFKLPVAK